VFSPILHTHHYDSMPPPQKEDYVGWDLGLLLSFKAVTVLMSKTAYDGEIWISSGCEREYQAAKAWGIPVLELEAFLDGKEVEL